MAQLKETLVWDPYDAEMSKQHYEDVVKPFYEAKEALKAEEARRASGAVLYPPAPRHQQSIHSEADINRAHHRSEFSFWHHTRPWYSQFLRKEAMKSTVSFSRFIKKSGGGSVLPLTYYNEMQNKEKKRRWYFKDRDGVRVTLGRLIELNRVVKMQERRKQRRESPALKKWLEENGTPARIGREKRGRKLEEKQRQELEEEKEEEEMGITMPAVSFAILVFRGKPKAME
jgi:hypothetical protein